MTRKVALDSNLFRHAASSGVFHVNDDIFMWGPCIFGTRTYELRFRSPNSTQIASEVPYVPALGLEGKNLGLDFYTTQFLQFETWHLKPATDWARRSLEPLFNATRISSPWDYNGVIAGAGVNLKEEMRRHIRCLHGSQLQEFIRQFGAKSSQDAHNIWSVERLGLDGMVTLDLALHRKFAQLRRALDIGTGVWLPSEICGLHGIKPVSDDWFAATDVFTRRVQILFQRRATLRDRFGYRIIHLGKVLARKSGVPFPRRLFGQI